MSQEKVICDYCRSFAPVHNKSTKNNGYCCYHEKPVNKTDVKCKKYERSYKEERIVTSGDFYKNRAFNFTKNKKQKEIDKRDLIIKLVEIGLIFSLVVVTIYFGLK